MTTKQLRHAKRRAFEQYCRTLHQVLPLDGERLRPESRDYQNDNTQRAWEFWQDGWYAGLAYRSCEPS